MKRKIKLIAVFLLILAFTVTLISCGREEAAVPKDGVVVTDMTGQVVQLDAPVKRIVVLTASDCEILYALGAGELIVGRGEYCDYPAEVLDVTTVRSGNDTNVEQIIALKPQVVVMSNMAQTNEQIKAIKNAGIQVIVSDAQNIEGVYTAIELLGKVVQKEAEAANLIAEMKETFDTIKLDKKDSEEKTVYFEVSPLEYGLWTAGTDTFMDEIAHMVGLKNIFSDVSGWTEISQEQVIGRDPDYIVAIPMSFDGSSALKEEIMDRKGWKHMKAIKNGNIYIANSDEITRPGPRLAKAASSLHSFVRGRQGE